jgi:hypothetical protein
MNWHDPSPWIAVVSLTVGALAILGVIWRLVRGVIRGFRKAVHLVDDLNGEDARPGQARRPGVLEQVAETRIAVDRVERKAEAAATLAAQSAKKTERAIQQHIWHVETFHIPDPRQYPHIPPEESEEPHA